MAKMCRVRINALRFVNHDAFLPPPGVCVFTWVCVCICVSVCLCMFVCQQDNSKTINQFHKKISGANGWSLRTNRLNFGLI